MIVWLFLRVANINTFNKTVMRLYGFCLIGTGTSDHCNLIWLTNVWIISQKYFLTRRPNAGENDINIWINGIWPLSFMKNIWHNVDVASVCLWILRWIRAGHEASRNNTAYCWPDPWVSNKHRCELGQVRILADMVKWRMQLNMINWPFRVFIQLCKLNVCII